MKPKDSDIGEPYQIINIELVGDNCVEIVTFGYEETVNLENIAWKISKDEVGKGVVVLNNVTKGSCAERYAEIFASEEQIKEFKQKIRPVPMP